MYLYKIILPPKIVMDSSRKKKYDRDWRLAMMIIPVYVILVALIYAVAFLWLYTLDPNVGRVEEEAENIVLLGLDSIAFDAALSPGNDQLLTTFYEEPDEDNPYVTISYTYITTPSTLTFVVKDNDDNTVSSTPSTANQVGKYIEKRYPLTSSDSSRYRIYYTLTGSTDVTILRIELNASLTSS